MNRVLSSLLAAAMLCVTSLSAAAAPLEQMLMASGALIGLAGTPHLWIADETGVLHWAGDTRALTGRTINWGNRRDVSLTELKSLRRGAPWLSAGLLKDGDPIFFVKWESADPAPQLLHIQSIADVELFGIDGANYGQFVLDRTAWEQRFGMSAATLRRGVLASAVGTTAAVPAATTTVQRGILANAITPEEKSAFFESALSLNRRGTLVKWVRPLRVQLRRSSYSSQSDIVDSMIAEANGLLNGLSVSRASTDADIVIDFLPLSEVVAASVPDALGYASPEFASNGALARCVISVAHDPESIFGSDARHVSPQMKTDLLGLVVRHEFGHCLGLGHNNSAKSFMSYAYDPWETYYTTGARTAQFNDFDRALLRTLYHSAVRAGMTRTDLGELFAT